MTQPFSLKSRIQSMAYALEGIADLLRHQHNARVHLCAAAVVLVLAAYCEVARWEWVALLLTIAMVWCTEALNTALEYIADACHPDQHPLIKRAKDAAAAAVLLSSLVAVVVGLMIFVPYLCALCI